MAEDRDVNNEDRANWAEAAVTAFATQTLVDPSAEVRATKFSDLLVDLNHLADRWGLSFVEVSARAGAMYLQEVDEDGGKAKFVVEQE